MMPGRWWLLRLGSGWCRSILAGFSIPRNVVDIFGGTTGGGGGGGGMDIIVEECIKAGGGEEEEDVC